MKNTSPSWSAASHLGLDSGSDLPWWVLGVVWFLLAALQLRQRGNLASLYCPQLGHWSISPSCLAVLWGAQSSNHRGIVSPQS